MSKNKIFLISFSLLVIGGLNWGLVGFFHFNLVDSIFGDMSFLSRTIYGIVGISAVAAILTIKNEK